MLALEQFLTRTMTPYYHHRRRDQFNDQQQRRQLGLRNDVESGRRGREQRRNQRNLSHSLSADTREHDGQRRFYLTMVRNIPDVVL